MLIGEVAQRAGISTRMLRYYDKVGIVSPSGRTVGGYREYADADIRRLFHVESLRSLGLSLRELRRALDDAEFTPRALLGDLIASTQERIDREQELVRRLRHVQASDAENWAEVLELISLMRGLDSDDPSRRQQIALATNDETPIPARMLAEAVLTENDPNVAGALRWALKRSEGDAIGILKPALESPHPETRRRAVTAIAELDTAEAVHLLAETLHNSDREVSGRAALALGARGDTRAVPVLLSMVIDGTLDVEASERLGFVAREHALTEQIAGTVTEHLANAATSLETRLRLTQALAELPGATARTTLAALAEDPHRPVALTAAYVLKQLGS